jgi:glycosyltransferase involved in cell wall biosynthesis
MQKMRSFLKKIFNTMPVFIRRFAVRIYSDYHIFKIKKFLKREYPNYLLESNRKRNSRPRVLFYHIAGLNFSGTEKFLQILAKHLDYNLYDVYFMYSPKPRSEFGDKPLDGRLDYFKNTPIKFIPFDYKKIENNPPYFIKGMSPSIFEVIKKFNIDLLIAAGAGYSEFPLNVIKEIPIILLNIFGFPKVQKNIIYNVCVSEAVANKIRPIVPEEKIKVMYVPSEGPTKNSFENSRILRRKLGIKDNEIVFGRIGRADNNIFDPIGIVAFKKVVKEMPWVHYLIMSPPTILREIVKEQRISNVHFLEPSSKEEDVWAFHQAIDVLAHFRKDGESFGLNIAEAMLCGKPIITHKSKYWNAHLEYLDESFSRVAEIDNVEQYAEYIKEFIELKQNGKILEIGEKAKEKAEKMFLIKNSINQFEEWIDETLK